jgi:hypothetical protein
LKVGLKLTSNELNGSWRLVKVVLDDAGANKIINDAIVNGTQSDTLTFMLNKTFVQSYGASFISTGNWSIVGSSIATTDSRFEPPQPNAILNSTLSFDNVEIKGDTLSMVAASEWTGRSFYIRIK